MKRILITTCALLLTYPAFSQQITRKNVELDDLLTLLRASDYELFSFDITDMLKDRYDLFLSYKVYTEGSETASINLGYLLPNKYLLTDYPESDWQEMIDKGQILDPVTKAVSHAENINIGFYPSGNDTTARMQISIPGIARMNGITLKKKAQTFKGSDKKSISYSTRTFKMNTFKDDSFIPLILFGSHWFDDNGVFRFCGDTEIDPSMSTEILKNIPHYYVIGVTFRKKL